MQHVRVRVMCQLARVSGRRRRRRRRRQCWRWGAQACRVVQITGTYHVCRFEPGRVRGKSSRHCACAAAAYMYVRTRQPFACQPPNEQARVSMLQAPRGAMPCHVNKGGRRIDERSRHCMHMATCRIASPPLLRATVVDARAGNGPETWANGYACWARILRIGIIEIVHWARTRRRISFGKAQARSHACAGAGVPVSRCVVGELERISGQGDAWLMACYQKVNVMIDFYLSLCSTSNSPEGEASPPANPFCMLPF